MISVGKTNKQSGFTIVELLIVIVVIGILAAITIVAYNGIQARANNAARISEAQQLAKVLSIYRTNNDQYPPLPVGVTRVCIGDGFADLNADGLGDCWDANKPGPTSLAHPDAAFNAALKTIATLPIGNRVPIVSTTYQRLGPVFDAGAATYYVHYWIEDSTATCPVGVKTWNSTDTVRCSIPLE
jgi:prepilin-type N-terminal cleavage/methylation domain-containing protein